MTRRRPACVFVPEGQDDRCGAFSVWALTVDASLFSELRFPFVVPVCMQHFDAAQLALEQLYGRYSVQAGEYV